MGLDALVIGGAGDCRGLPVLRGQGIDAQPARHR